MAKAIKPVKKPSYDIIVQTNLTADQLFMAAINTPVKKSNIKKK